MPPHLQDLSPELLIKIFGYCGLQDLQRLMETCKRFAEILVTSSGLGSTTPYILVTNQLKREMRNRSTKLLTFPEKIRISNNWSYGQYGERNMLKTKVRYRPWLVLARNHLWISRGNKIYAYKRKSGGIEDVKPSDTIVSPNETDISKFVFKQDYLLSGQESGSVHIWKKDGFNLYLANCHQADINSVDLEGNIFVTGSRDGTIKLWSLDINMEQPHEPLHTNYFNDRVWSTAICSGSNLLAVGTAGLNSIPPLHIIDVNRNIIVREYGSDFRNGSGILHSKWESPSILLTCGYDTNIRKWDTRTKACVQSWVDPFYSTVYCFETDNNCTLLTGTERNGRVVLWDTRTKGYNQIYFMKTCKRRMLSSPVYCLSFDAVYLFVATDSYLNILDFSVKLAERKDYHGLQMDS